MLFCTNFIYFFSLVASQHCTGHRWLAQYWKFKCQSPMINMAFNVLNYNFSKYLKKKTFKRILTYYFQSLQNFIKLYPLVEEVVNIALESGPRMFPKMIMCYNDALLQLANYEKFDKLIKNIEQCAENVLPFKFPFGYWIM